MKIDTKKKKKNDEFASQIYFRMDGLAMDSIASEHFIKTLKLFFALSHSEGESLAQDSSLIADLRAFQDNLSDHIKSIYLYSLL